MARVVHERLPGWTVEHIDRSWEGAFAVVTTCADRELGFQYRPGQAPGTAWLNPSDAFTRERLAATSDHWRHLVWSGDPAIVASLSCEEELTGGRELASERNEYD